MPQKTLLILAAWLLARSRASPGTCSAEANVDCTYQWAAASGDTCSTLASEWGLHEDAFQGLNPCVDCSQDLTAGQDYCVEGTASDGGSGGASPTSTTFSTSTTTTAPADSLHPSPTQSGIVSDCISFYKLPPNTYCQDIVNKYGNVFTLQQFYDWNPAVGDECADLIVGDYYCVGVPSTPTAQPTTTTSTTSEPYSPHQTGIASDCNRWYLAQSGDSCEVIANKYGAFSVNQFEEWNPAVGETCTDLILGDWYCIGVPGTPTTRLTTTSSPYEPHQTGIVSSCDRWYQAASGDNCQSIVDKYGTFSLNQFEDWNPAVGSSCSYLVLGDWYCVGVPGTPTSRPSTTTDTHQPHQTGIASNCDRWYTVVADDTCDSIVQEFRISLGDFYSWNPAVGSNCQSLWVGYNVCVGVK